MEIDSTFESLSRLEKLPVELVYSIFKSIPAEVLIKARAASRTLKYYIDKYSKLIEIPSVHSIRICGPGVHKGNFSSYMEFTIIIPYNNRKNFELKLVREPRMLVRITTNRDNGSDEESFKAYFFDFDHAHKDTTALEYLAECLGTHVELVELQYNTGRIASTLLSGNLHIAELTVLDEQLSEEAVNSFLQICSSNTIAHLHMHVDGFANNDPGEVLLNIASHIPSLYIVDSVTWTKNDTEVGMLFGVPHVDWASIIIEMFERRIDRRRRIETLNITIHWPSGYLSRESADLLIKKLPMLEKKFWFATSCSQYDEGLNYKRNKCAIRADSSDNGVLCIRRLTITNRNDITYY